MSNYIRYSSTRISHHRKDIRMAGEYQVTVLDTPWSGIVMSSDGTAESRIYEVGAQFTTHVRLNQMYIKGPYGVVKTDTIPDLSSGGELVHCGQSVDLPHVVKGFMIMAIMNKSQVVRCRQRGPNAGKAYVVGWPNGQ